MRRAVSVDDEPLAIRALRRLLAAHPEVTVVGTAGTLEAARAAIEDGRPDLLFLDIDLGAGDGFELIAGLPATPAIIFVTAHPQHAVDAFAVEAVDYLLKPIAPARLAAALARAGRRLGPPAEPARAALALRMPGRTVMADPAEIVVLRAEGDFTRVHLAGQPPLLILRPLGQFEALLPAGSFLRAGRSLLLNLDRVRRLEAEDRNRARLWLEGLADAVPLGRDATARLRAALAARPAAAAPAAATGAPAG